MLLAEVRSLSLSVSDLRCCVYLLCLHCAVDRWNWRQGGFLSQAVTLSRLEKECEELLEGYDCHPGEDSDRGLIVTVTHSDTDTQAGADVYESLQKAAVVLGGTFKPAACVEEGEHCRH